MAFDENFLQEVKYRNDIEQLISSYVTLRRRGSTLVGLCPFHSEKTGSFTVFPDTQSYYCFGCGAGGDAITFIRQIENLDYPDAVRFLAERAGIPVPEQDFGEKQAMARRTKMIAAYKDAARYYHSVLMSPEGEKGLAYLNRRKLSPATIRHFGLGYAPERWDGLLSHMLSRGYSREELLDAKLVTKGKSGNLYDVFRGRVMFPIIDTRGNVIAFGGRVMDDGQPKYLNSNDTLLFKKSYQLFALNYAKNKNDGKLILAEGYMDVISLHQAGFANAVATLGTAITDKQARLISRYAKLVYIAYDSDGAGQKATQKAINLLYAAGLEVRIINMSPAKDPDEYIGKFGRERFKFLLEGAGNHIKYRLDQARSKYQLELPEQKAAFLKEAVDILAALESSIEAEVYLDRLALETGISKDVLYIELKKAKKKVNRHQQTPALPAEANIYKGRDTINPQRAKHLRAAKAEEGLIGILMENPDYFDRVKEKISPDAFVTAFNRQVADTLWEKLEQGLSPDPARFNDRFTPEQMGRIIGFSRREGRQNTIEEAYDLIDVILQEGQKVQVMERSEQDAAYLADFIQGELAKRKAKGGKNNGR